MAQEPQVTIAWGAQEAEKVLRLATDGALARGLGAEHEEPRILESARRQLERGIARR